MVSTFYAAKTGGSAVTSITTDSNGAYLAWIDNSDYAGGSIFSLILSKSTHKEVPVHFGLPGLSFKDATEILTNKTFTLPQINDTSSDHQYIYAVNELSADRTITLPLLTANDTFVFTNFIQTLTGKNIGDATDNTKDIAFALSGATTGKTLTLISAHTDDRSITFPNVTDTLIGALNKLSDLAATTSAELAGIISDETGTGVLVFATSPTLVTPILGVASATDLTLTGSAASTPDANTLTKDHLVGARCTFNGTGTPAYIEEINFSGAITDNGAGDYTLTIDRDFASANYSYHISTIANDFGSAKTGIATGSIGIMITNASDTNPDNSNISVILIGAQ